ncbi:hypothetical protein GGR51DRAFT_562826 [Nemania sp. FL0031]|nr:hypothetical protein GGR51DRAFT_562826 [Nemania sp. FL0031]
MKFPSILALMVGTATNAAAFDLSSLPNGVYKIPIGDNGMIDYINAIDLHFPALCAPDGPTMGANTSIDTINEDSDDDGYDDVNDLSIGGKVPGGHCHWRWPVNNTDFLAGHQPLNMAHYPLAFAMLMDWMAKGGDRGWLRDNEVRMMKYEDVVVGACIFGKPHLLTCLHEASLAMLYSSHACGMNGCHVCVRHWHKDYFRFATIEAPNKCECGWA